MLKIPARILLAAAGVLALAGTAGAQFDFRSSQQQRSAEQLTGVQVVTDATHPVVPGETVHLAVVFTIEAPWHLYWKNPGEGAMPPRVTVTAPDGFSVGETRWPRPKVLPSTMGDMYCYEGEFALFIPVTAPERLADGQARFAIEANWAVCDEEMCLFGSAKRDIELPTTSSTVRTLDARPVHPLIGRHRGRLAHLAGDAGDDAEDAAAAELRGDTLHLTVPAHGFDQAAFMPHQSPGVTYGEARISRAGENVQVEIDLQVEPNNFLNGPPNVGGLVALGTKGDDPSYEFSLPLARD